MADYSKAFNHVFGADSAMSIPLESLRGWQTMQSQGFNEGEVYSLFKCLYCREIWQSVSLNDINDQCTANMIFLAALRGFLMPLLQEFQSYFSLAETGSLDSETLRLINQVDGPEFQEWLYWGICYQQLLELNSFEHVRTKFSLSNS